MKVKGMAANEKREGKQNLPSKIRKKSAFTVFKSEYLSSETGTVRVFNLCNRVKYPIQSSDVY